MTSCDGFCNNKLVVFPGICLSAALFAYLTVLIVKSISKN